MKKLNNKGFTLIELLAVIVILAIIMVVTIPTVLNSMGSARQNTFNTSANTVADWVEKEYALAMVGGTDVELGGADESFTDVCITDAKPGTGAVAKTGYKYCADQAAEVGTAIADAGKPNGVALDSTSAAKMVALLKAAGVDPTNYSYVYIKVTNGRACVKLGAAQKKTSSATNNNAQFANVEKGLAKSTGC